MKHMIPISERAFIWAIDHISWVQRMGKYSGSQKYLPTFEPTLHQDFWLCLC